MKTILVVLPVLFCAGAHAQPCDYRVERFETRVMKEERFEGYSPIFQVDSARALAFKRCTDRFRLSQCEEAQTLLRIEQGGTFVYAFGREVEKVAKLPEVIRLERCQKLEACEVAAVNSPDASVQSIELWQHLIKEYGCE